MQDPYCYPGTGVLINKLGITDWDELCNAERDLSSIREIELLRSQIIGEFNLAHLQKIHCHLFQDVYDWAGEIRTVDIAKGSLFCRADLIKVQADAIFKSLKENQYLLDLGAGQLTKQLAYYLAEINAIHPFREGNGRAEREFIRELAFQNGYFLSFAGVSQEEMVEASKASFAGDYVPLEEMLGRGLRPI